MCVQERLQNGAHCEMSVDNASASKSKYLGTEICEQAVLGLALWHVSLYYKSDIYKKLKNGYFHHFHGNS